MKLEWRRESDGERLEDRVEISSHLNGPFSEKKSAFGNEADIDGSVRHCYLQLALRLAPTDPLVAPWPEDCSQIAGGGKGYPSSNPR